MYRNRHSDGNEWGWWEGRGEWRLGLVGRAGRVVKEWLNERQKRPLSPLQEEWCRTDTGMNQRQQFPPAGAPPKPPKDGLEPPKDGLEPPKDGLEPPKDGLEPL